jgi:hypothetical protein
MVNLNTEKMLAKKTNGRFFRGIARFLALMILLAACGPKPYYKTHKGKKKQKYYNEIQFGGKSASEMKH